MEGLMMTKRRMTLKRARAQSPRWDSMWMIAPKSKSRTVLFIPLRQILGDKSRLPRLTLHTPHNLQIASVITDCRFFTVPRLKVRRSKERRVSCHLYLVESDPATTARSGHVVMKRATWMTEAWVFQRG